MVRIFKRPAAAAIGAAAVLAAAAGPALAGPTPTRGFASHGSGTETSLSAPGCQNTGTHDCTVATNGTANTTHMGVGPYVSDLTIHWGSATSNGDGGYCAPADGTSTITGVNGDTITEDVSGMVCEVGPTSLTAPHTFTGTFTITGGTGRFADATGSGTVTGGDDGFGNSSYQESGTISY
jgi:hypothetical protein